MSDRDRLRDRADDTVLDVAPDSSNPTLDAVLEIIADFFPSELSEISPGRLAEWEQDLAGGRDPHDLRRDIFKYVVGSDLIRATFGVDTATAEDLISGSTSFSDFFQEQFGGRAGALAEVAKDPLFRGSVDTGKTSIYRGADLYRVRDSKGNLTFYAVYEYGGIRESYRIGDQSQLDELFEDTSIFETVRNLTDTQYRNQEFLLDVGEIDEVLGQQGSYGANREAELAAIGEEALPGWVRKDRRAMMIYATAAAEGWSEGRTLREVSRLDSFENRFGAWDWALKRSGGDEVAAMSLYRETEGGLRAAFDTYQSGSRITNNYLAGLMEGGWTADNAVPILRAVNKLDANPEMLSALNTIIRSNGGRPIGRVGAIALLSAAQLDPNNRSGLLADAGVQGALNGNTPALVFDLVNDAVVLHQLQEAGFQGVDLEFARQLRNETEGVLDENGLRQFAQTAAANVLTFATDLDLGSYGLSEESLVAAAFGREDPEGRSVADVGNLLGKISRSRQASQSGVATAQTFINDQGRLVARGLAG